MERVSVPPPKTKKERGRWVPAWSTPPQGDKARDVVPIDRWKTGTGNETEQHVNPDAPSTAASDAFEYALKSPSVMRRSFDEVYKLAWPYL